MDVDHNLCRDCQRNPNRNNKRFPIGRGLHFYELTGQSQRYSFIRGVCLNCDAVGHYSSHCDRPQVQLRCTYCTASGHNAEACKRRLEANNILYDRGYVREPISADDTTALLLDVPADFVPVASRDVAFNRRTDYRVFAARQSGYSTVEAFLDVPDVMEVGSADAVTVSPIPWPEPDWDAVPQSTVDVSEPAVDISEPVVSVSEPISDPVSEPIPEENASVVSDAGASSVSQMDRVEQVCMLIYRFFYALSFVNYLF